MIKKILVPLDGSRLAECALPYAGEVAAKLGAGVVLVSVTHRIQGFRPEEDPGDVLFRPAGDVGERTGVHLVPEGVCSMEEQAATYLGKAAKTLEDEGVKVRKEVLCGNPAKEIIAFANSEDCDLVVMSTHGRSGPGKWVRGSVADRVFKGVRAPVMMVRGPGCEISE